MASQQSAFESESGNVPRPRNWGGPADPGEIMQQGGNGNRHIDFSEDEDPVYTRDCNRNKRSL